MSLDRRRLEEAHLIFSILDVFWHYPSKFEEKKVYTSVQQTLDVVTPIFYDAFTSEYACK